MSTIRQLTFDDQALQTALKHIENLLYIIGSNLPEIVEHKDISPDGKAYDAAQAFLYNETERTSKEPEF